MPMNIGHLLIEKDNSDKYIVNNTINNKYIRLGKREVQFLVERLGGVLETEKAGKEVPLSNEQKMMLDKKFEEWGFFDIEKYKKKRDIANCVIFEIQPRSILFHIVKLFTYFISPLGFLLLSVSAMLAYISIERCAGRMMRDIMDIDLSPKAIIVFYIIMFLSSCIHELFHEASSFKYSKKLGKIGIKLFYLLPAFFCDVSNMYMINSRKKCVYISCAGVLSNLFIGNIAIITYALNSNSSLSNLFLMIYIANISNVIFNLIPFAKFDGYWILKSMTGIDNLYDKSISLFFILILSGKQYIKTSISGIIKIMMTIYGFSIYFFHWFLWIYSIWALHERLNFGSDSLRQALVLLLSLIGIYSCISFTIRYIKGYKEHIYIEGGE